ncbi:uncharacterized protein LOC111297567, partial [Durio zibethinus]|uniref:Uncharacterized protein LOC111297567 n=1 Tax=Durio zibethinus TaxID=66656 RepID=A0A6P5Z5X0_DURZI
MVEFTCIWIFFSYLFQHKLLRSIFLSAQVVEEMEAPMKYICILAFLVIMTIAGFNGVEGHDDYGPCGKHNIEKEAEKLAPCTKAAQDVKAPVSNRCCTVMEKKLKNPSCLCAIMFAHSAYNAGIKPEVAVTIPKRCNIAVR